jgi:lipid-A-disaccharide synthase
MPIFISVGESSGDMHAAHVIQAIKHLNPTTTIYGNGGKKMADAGCTIIHNVVNKSSIGFLEGLVKAPYFLGVFKRTKAFILTHNIDTVLVIDHQGFNIPLAKWCHQRNIRIISFISPQFWMWGKKRSAIQFTSYCHKIICIFKEEFEYYSTIAPEKARFYGHPLGAILPPPSPIKKDILGLFPGSREQEIDHCLPVMLTAARQIIADNPRLECHIAVTSSQAETHIKAMSTAMDCPVVIRHDSHALINDVQASLVASGTVSLEHAILGAPCVVLYKFSWLSHAILKAFIWPKIKTHCSGFVALPNILSKKQVCQELLQNDASSSALQQAILPLLVDSPERTRLVQQFNRVRQLCQPEPGIFEAIAKDIMDSPTTSHPSG